MKLYIVTLLLMLLQMSGLAAGASAAEKSVRLRTFSMEDGLPSNSIAMINTGRKGLVWIATWNGLCNYDGYRFNTFQTTPGDEQVLHGNRLNYVMPAPDGDVWVTTFDNRLFLLDADKRGFIDCDPQLKALGLNDFRVQYMQRLGDGSIWINGFDGVNLKADNGQLQIIESAYEKPDYSTLQDKRGREWHISGNGVLTCKDTSGETPVVKSYQCILPAGYPKIVTERSLLSIDKNGTLWIVPDGLTVSYYDEEKDRVVPMNLREVDPTLPGELDVTHPMIDIDGSIWFRSRFNLCHISFGEMNFSHRQVAQDAETRAMFIDSKERLWVGTKQGHVALIMPDSQVMQFLTQGGKPVATQTIFDIKGIYSLYEDSHHNLWIGTRGGGLYRLVPIGDSFKVEHYLRSAVGEVNGAEHIYDIKEDKYGRVWLATYGGGIMYYDYAKEDFVTPDACQQLLLPEGNIRKVRRIETAADGTLIFSTTEGIVTVSPDFKTPEDIKLNITPYAPGTANSLLAPDVLQTLLCRHSDASYVATVGGAIQNILSDNLLESPLKFGIVDQGFSNMGNVRGMVEDDNGSVWLIGENTIHRLSEDGKSQRTFTKNDWGRNMQFSEVNPIYYPKVNKIIAGTLGGLLSFSPETLKSEGDVPPIVFTGIQYQGDESPTSLIGEGEIKMPADCHNAIIYFAALDYDDNVQIRYAYRIRELGDVWNYGGSEHCASLSNLPPGHYTLEVRSTNNEGEWVDNTATLKIFVEPTFWQSPIAWILYIVIAALLLNVVVYLFRLRNAHRMEKKLKEHQLRFFTDISHQLRTPLTLIDAPIKEVLETEQLSDKSEKLLRTVETNAAKMLELVNQTLDLEKLEQLGEDVENAPATDVEAVESSEADLPVNATPGKPQGIGDITILVVEDNDEVRYLLKSSLSKYYNIIEASNGKEGLKLAMQHQPDFIITDIMMPEMDGITMIRKIKSDESICHIPIIILSARTADVYRIEGLKEGADDYITKPFSMSYLQVRVESIVRQRRALQEEWRNNIATPVAATETAEPQEEKTDEMPEIDRKFVAKLTEYINENLGEADLRIDDIASAMCMSRTVLYGKIRAIYGLSPSDLIRNVRITRACEILRQDFTKNVAEVAMAVGYNDAKYFARSFKEMIGMTPSAYRKGASS